MTEAGAGATGEETVSSPNNKVKFLCSHGGKILPRPPDGQLKYVGGETRVVSVPRDINFSELTKKLSNLCDGDVILKYQVLPEDLDTLISVTCDEDLRNMLIESDRQEKKSSISETTGSSMLRTFLFPSIPTNIYTPQLHPETMDTHVLEQHYIDAINGVLGTPVTIRRRRHPSYNISSAGSSPKGHDGYTFDAPKEIPRVNSSPSLYNLGQQQYNHYYQPSPTMVYPPHPASAGFHHVNGHHLAPALSAGRNDFARYQMGYPSPSPPPPHHHHHRPPRYYYSPTTPSTPRGGSCGSVHGDDCRIYRSGGLEMVVSLPHGSVDP